TIAYLQGYYQAAKIHAEAWVAYRRAGGISSALDIALYGLGRSALEFGDDAEAKIHFEEGIQVATDQQRHEGIAEGYADLGILAALRGDTTAAEAYYETSQASLRSAGLKPGSFDDEPENLGFLALLLGHYDHALAHYGDALMHY